MVVRITLTDGLRFPNGNVAAASYTCVIFCRVPADWLDDGALKSAALEKVLAALYGHDWRLGNDDGSRYVVLSLATHILSPNEAAASPWRDAQDSATHHYWFFHATPDGAVNTVTPADF